MTCRHAAGDPACGQYERESLRDRARAAEERASKLDAQLNPKTPDSARYEIVEAVAVGPNLVMKVLYPNCAKCSYEGNKVMVFLGCATIDALKWRKIDPHFRSPTQMLPIKEAPSPAARFPASDEGWKDALEYARSKA